MMIIKKFLFAATVSILAATVSPVFAQEPAQEPPAALAPLSAPVDTAAPVPASTSPSPVSSSVAAAVSQSFGVVDMQKILHETKAAKGIFDEIESRRKEYQTQISKEEETLRAAEQDIRKQKDALSKEEFEKKRKDFEKSVLEGQQMVQEHKQTLDKVFNGSMAKLREQAAEIVANVAKDRGYSAVFTQDSVMLSVPEMDMTDDVIKRMNDKVGQIKVEWPSSEKK